MKRILLVLAIVACLTIQALPVFAQGSGVYFVQLMIYENDEWVDLQEEGECFEFFIDDGGTGYYLYPSTNANGKAAVNVTYCESWQYRYVGPTYIVDPWEYFPVGWWWNNWSNHDNVLLVREQE